MGVVTGTKEENGRGQGCLGRDVNMVQWHMLCMGVFWGGP